jgi:RNA polymerase sigma-70 factor (sigma-E family)
VTDTAAYREYVSARLDRLRRTAYLLCGDWHTADDLVSTALVKLLRHWRRAAELNNLDGYVRTILLRAWLDERRRPWRRERSYAQVPDVPMDAGPNRVADRLAIMGLLAELPPRRRAVLVLRYYCDLSVEETAEALGCTAGTVKSQTARGLDALRARLGQLTITEEDPLWA